MFLAPFAAKFCQSFLRPSPPHIFPAAKILDTSLCFCGPSMFSPLSAAKFWRAFPRPGSPYVFSAVKYWMALSSFAALACFWLPSPLNSGRPFLVRARLMFFLPLNIGRFFLLLRLCHVFGSLPPLNLGRPFFVQACLIFSLPLNIGWLSLLLRLWHVFGSL